MTTQENKNGAFVGLDTANNPGTQGLYALDSNGNGLRIYQYATATAWLAPVGSTTAIITPALAMQGALSSFGDGSLDIGSTSARFRDVYHRRDFVKNHAAFTGSESVRDTGAVQTTNAAATTAYTLAIPDNSCVGMAVRVVCRDTATGNRGYWMINAGVYRQAAGAATFIVGSSTQLAQKAVPAWDAIIAVSGNNAVVTVTGAVGSTINWAVTCDYQAVIGNA